MLLRTLHTETQRPGGCMEHLRYFVLCVISDKTYYVIICLRQLLYVCKAENTCLNYWDVIGGWGLCVD